MRVRAVRAGNVPAWAAIVVTVVSSLLAAAVVLGATKGELATRIDNVEGRQDRIETRIEKRLDAIDRKLESLKALR